MILLTCQMYPEEKGMRAVLSLGFKINAADNIRMRHLRYFQPSPADGTVWISPVAFLPPTRQLEDRINYGSLVPCISLHRRGWRHYRKDFLLTPSQDDNRTALVAVVLPPKEWQLEPKEIIMAERRYAGVRFLIRLAPRTSFEVTRDQHTFHITWDGERFSSPEIPDISRFCSPPRP